MGWESKFPDRRWVKCVSRSDILPPPHPPPQLSPCIATQLSPHTQTGMGGGSIICVHHSRGEERRPKPSPQPTPPAPARSDRRDRSIVLLESELQISQDGQQGNWQEQALGCCSFRARGHSHPPALPPSPRASLLSIHSKSIFLPFADAQFQPGVVRTQELVSVQPSVPPTQSNPLLAGLPLDPEYSVPCYRSLPSPSNVCSPAHKKCDKCCGSLRDEPGAGGLV